MKIDSVSVSNQNVRASESSEAAKSVEAVSKPSQVERKQSHDTKVEGDQYPVNDEMLDKAIEQANQSLKMYDKKIERVVHDVTKTVMYTVKDTKTDEVIREFPPKKIQDMIAKMWELAGLFVDKKA